MKNPITHIKTSAPGKLFLSGEYAVLTGAPAIVTSVNRKAIATFAPSYLKPSPVVAAVSKQLTKHFTNKGLVLSDPLPSININTEKFSIHRNKIGIGSSAAVAVTACGLWFEWAGFSISKFKSEIYHLAKIAHTNAQKGKGSGADVAAAAMGGTILFKQHHEPTPISNPNAHTVFLWTGKAASTVQLVGHIGNLKKNNPKQYQTRMDHLNELSESLATAYQSNHIHEIIQGTQNYNDAMYALGRDADVPIVTEEMLYIGQVAKQFGGAAKPSGAGGGDMVLAVFETDEDAAHFRRHCLNDGHTTLDMDIHAPGLQLELE